MFLQVAVFLLVLSVLVLVHEFGHFVAARLAGIGILEFALGLPFTRPLVSKRLKSGMKMSVYPILFGGFVSLLGEERDSKSLRSDSGQADANKIEGGMFYEKPVVVRMAVVAAGVTMNLILAIVVFYLFLGLSGFKVLLPKFVPHKFLSPEETRVLIADVVKESPADAAGLKSGDVILGVDQKKFATSDAFKDYIRLAAGQEVVLTLTDVNFRPTRSVTAVPREVPPEGEGPLGIGIGEVILISYTTPAERLFSGLIYTTDMFLYNFKAVGFLAGRALETRDVGPISENVAGPVGIFSLVGDILGLDPKQALITLINVLGILSLSLAVMNIMPFPALDGGKLVFLLIEGVSRKKMSPKLENLINQIGFALLFGLVILISFNDIGKLFRR